MGSAALGQAGRTGESFAQTAVALMMPALGWLMPRRLWPIQAGAMAAAMAAAMLSALTEDLPGVQVLESNRLQALADSAGA